jgi:hypothetical protein
VCTIEVTTPRQDREWWYMCVSLRWLHKDRIESGDICVYHWGAQWHTHISPLSILSWCNHLNDTHTSPLSILSWCSHLNDTHIYHHSLSCLCVVTSMTEVTTPRQDREWWYMCVSLRWLHQDRIESGDICVYHTHIYHHSLSCLCVVTSMIHTYITTLYPVLV